MVFCKEMNIIGGVSQKKIILGDGLQTDLYFRRCLTIFSFYFTFLSNSFLFFLIGLFSFLYFPFQSFLIRLITILFNFNSFPFISFPIGSIHSFFKTFLFFHFLSILFFPFFIFSFLKNSRKHTIKSF